MATASNSTVACIGSGTIGSAWASLFASYGLEVKVYDPSHRAQTVLHDMTARAAHALSRPVEELLDRLTFTTDLQDALQGVSFVQEGGPESLPLKQQLYEQIERCLPPDVIIASSTSDLPISAIQLHCRHPERTVVGHPINPPYAIELVEVVGGGRTSAQTLDRACAFYRSVGRKPLRIERETRGFIANRLQIALLREAVQMVARGEATISQIDFALMHGIGVRWAAVGMFGAYLLNLPDRNVQTWLDHFERIGFGSHLVHTEPFPDWSPALRDSIAAQWQARADEPGVQVLMRERDAVAIQLARYR